MSGPLKAVMNQEAIVKFLTKNMKEGDAKLCSDGETRVAYDQMVLRLTKVRGSCGADFTVDFNLRGETIFTMGTGHLLEGDTFIISRIEGLMKLEFNT